MNQLKGYAGRILGIDLTRAEVCVKELTKDFARKYIGGRGFTSRILWDHVGPEIAAYGEKNRLVFATGPLSGTIMPSSGRLTVAAKSPISNIIGDSNSGGYWGPELKWAGYDVLVINGKAKKPVYINIKDDIVEIRDAKELWGKDISETESTIKRNLGNPDVKIASIGPAGENLVRFASVVTDSFFLKNLFHFVRE